MVKVDIVDLKHVSYRYMMSQVPRVGDTILLTSDDIKPSEWVEAIVKEVKWILAKDEYSSDHVVVSLGIPGA